MLSTPSVERDPKETEQLLTASLGVFGRCEVTVPSNLSWSGTKLSRSSFIPSCPCTYTLEVNEDFFGDDRVVDMVKAKAREEWDLGLVCCKKPWRRRAEKRKERRRRRRKKARDLGLSMQFFVSARKYYDYSKVRRVILFVRSLLGLTFSPKTSKPLARRDFLLGFLLCHPTGTTVLLSCYTERELSDRFPTK